MTEYVWQRCLDVAEIDATGYHDNTRSDLVDALEFSPTRVLDIGCGAGSTGAYLKAKFPAAKVWGVELNKAAAKIAAERLDHVISSRFEDVELETVGIERGSLDLVLCADVLEHLYNPWQIMMKLRHYLAADGKVVISIPNIRFLPLLDDLARGYWRYADNGILDITHLRFFTLQELRRFLHETGYAIQNIRYGLDPTLIAQMQQYKKKLPCTIDTGKLILRDVDEQELLELHSGQFFVTAVPASTVLTGYEPPKMGSCFWRGQQTDYLQFLQAHQMTPHEARAFDVYIDRLEAAPVFEIVIVCNDRTVNQLAGTLGAIARQLYSRTRITVIGEGPAPAAIAASGQISWISSAAPWQNIDAVFKMSSADWLILLDAGDQIVGHALPYVAELGMRAPEAAMIYVDEDQLDAGNRPDRAYFKPGFSPDYLLAFPYLGDGVFVRRTQLLAAGGLRTRGYGDPLYDLALRLYASRGISAIRHIPDVLYRRHPQRSLPREQGGPSGSQRAVDDFLETTKQAASLKPGLLPGSRSISHQVQGTPIVALITQAPDDLERCRLLIEQTYLKRAYPRARLLVFVPVDARTDVLQYMIEADAAGVDGLEVYQSHEGQSLLQRFDAAIRQTDADIVIVMREGLQPASKEWLTNLIAEAQRPALGAAAPRIVDMQGNVVGNGLILGCGGIASGFGHGRPFDDWGHFGRQLVAQNPSALSLDALAFRRQTYLDSGGFDLALDTTAAAIDYCLRLRQAGLRLLWSPDTTLIAHDNQLAGIDAASEHTLIERWLPQIAQDPFYNRNLSRNLPFALVEKPQVSRLRLPWKPLPRLLAFPADMMGCGHYRVIEPFNAAVAAGKIDGYLGVDHYSPFDLSMFDADTLLLQRQVTDPQLQYLEQYRKFFSLRLVYELDDLITNVPVRSFHRSQMPKDIVKRLRTGLRLCDRFIVSTAALAEAYSQFANDIRVVPNRIDDEKWGHLRPARRTGRKPRVGWAGGLSHGGDLAEVADVVKELAGEVEWVFLGMCPENIRRYASEFHLGVPTPQYPAKLASLNLDLAIAPIEHNDFNECKSNLKLLEYGVLGYPVIASDFGPYRCNFPVTLVKNRSRDWINAIREQLSDLDALAARGDALRSHVRSHWLLQDHLDEWIDAWFKF
jgi:2-polyprenyl-3-methyl-5-hydroxy-6-metoxy-1,4-benzoquinol methylase/glycosyltransferase involved in cell wall biosynthesis